MFLSFHILENKKIAVIDLGTNTFELLIAEAQEQGFEIIYQEKIGVFIGRDGIEKGLINAEAQNCALEALLHYKEIGLRYKVPIEKFFGVATSAFRSAKNGKQFIQELAHKTGISLEIISGDLEAEYIYQGVKNAIKLNENNALIMDIGGGSVEFVIANQRKIFWKRSFDIGAQRLKDMFMKNDPISHLEIQKMEIYLESQLVELSQMLFNYGPKLLIGSAGAFDTLAEMAYLRNNPETKEAVNLNGYSVLADDFHYLYHQIVTQNRENRLKIPGMMELRVEMIVVAVCLLKFVLDKTELDFIHTSRFALKEGYLLNKL